MTNATHAPGRQHQHRPNEHLQPIGERIATLRCERRLSQVALAHAANLDQPRLSRIEKGQLAASIEVIDRLAIRLNLSCGYELVHGTDKEKAYRDSLSLEDLAAVDEAKKAVRALTLFYLQASYQRIFNAFEALYGGGMACRVGLLGEALYIQLQTNCEKALKAVAKFAPELRELHFPDHLESMGDEDLPGPIDCWGIGDRAGMCESLNGLTKLAILHGVPSEEAQVAILERWGLNEVDRAIERACKERVKCEAYVWRKYFGPEPRSNGEN